ncbi:kinase-like domain-containing protein [Rhizophagus irregularis DAOM 181602=DAOM 197198]|nr:kinase-like domain-containing protein [Rhizophagus irregularis DAOM 181602=DAOM 197198]
MEFVQFDRFINIKLISEGGFSKIYKATWMDGPISRWNDKQQNYRRDGEMIVVLKELNDSKNIDSKQLSELKVFYNLILQHRNHGDYNDFDNHNYTTKYFGMTQNPITQNYMIITKYYKSGNLSNYITNDFFNISWHDKLIKLLQIISGLKNIHYANIIHKDYHSGNIFIDYLAIISDLGINQSAIDNSEIYGVIPYVAPEVFQGQKYIKASDIYSLGMIMWELMNGRKPFWDQNHDINLIIEICNGFRPPIVTNAPEGYIELMQNCWHSDPNKRPTASDIFKIVENIIFNESKISCFNPTKIIYSPNIGPVTTYNPGAIYKSRLLSELIGLVKSTLSNQRMILEFRHYPSINDKRIYSNCDLIENNHENDKSIKRIKLFEDGNNDYLTGFDIENNNTNYNVLNNNDY